MDDSTGVPLLRTDLVKVVRLGTVSPIVDGMMLIQCCSMNTI
jgi:hypothetical protein